MTRSYAREREEGVAAVRGILVVVLGAVCWVPVVVGVGRMVGAW